MAHSDSRSIAQPKAPQQSPGSSSPQDKSVQKRPAQDKNTRGASHERDVQSGIQGSRHH